jgi:hypothetical protein
VLAIRLHVSGTDGSVRGVSALTDTLVVDPNTSQFDEDGEEYDVSTHFKFSDNSAEYAPVAQSPGMALQAHTCEFVTL